MFMGTERAFAEQKRKIIVWAFAKVATWQLLAMVRCHLCIGGVPQQPEMGAGT